MPGLHRNENSARRHVTVSIGGVCDEETAERVRGFLATREGIDEAQLEARPLGPAVTLTMDVAGTDMLAVMADVAKDFGPNTWLLPYEVKRWRWEGQEVAYGVAGSQGPTLVLIHGFGSSAAHFRKLVAKLSLHARVYAIDLLGFGASSKDLALPYSPGLWASQVEAFVRSVVGGPVVLVGNSLGSLVALMVAQSLEGTREGAGGARVQGLVLMNVPGAMNQRGMYEHELRQWSGVLRPFFWAFELALGNPVIAKAMFDRFSQPQQVRRALTMRLSGGMPTKVHGIHGQSDGAQELSGCYYDESLVTEELIAVLRDPATHSGAWATFAAVWRNDPGPRPEPLSRSLALPMLLPWGECDPWTPLAGAVGRSFARLAEDRPDVTPAPLPRTGHCPMDERPGKVAAMMEAWLRETGIAKASPSSTHEAQGGEEGV